MVSLSFPASPYFGLLASPIFLFFFDFAVACYVCFMFGAWVLRSYFVLPS